MKVERLSAGARLLPGLLICVILAPGVASAQEEPDSTTVEAQDQAAAPTDLDVARDYLVTLDAAKQQLKELLTSDPGSEGEEFELLKVEALAIVESFDEVGGKLVTAIGRLEPEAATTDSVRQLAGQHLRYQLETYNRAADRAADRLIDLRDQRDDVEPAELSELESRITTERQLVNTLLGYGAGAVPRLEALGVDAQKPIRNLDHLLAERGDQLSGRLQIAVMERNRIRERIATARKSGATDQELADDRNRLQALEQRIDGIVISLDQTANLLAGRGEDVTKYRQLVIQTTGKVTDRILDPKVLLGLIKDGLENFGRYFKNNGPTWIVRILILIATIVAARLTARVIWWIANLFWRRGRASRLLSDLVGRMIVPLATITGLILGLWFLGADPTTLLTGVGVLSVIIGLALQDSLGNLAAGMFILIYRPYDVDDAVRAGGVVGMVKAMGLANTTIVTFDNRRLFVPNRKIWQEVIENRSSETYRRVEVAIRISYREDLEAAMEVIRKILAANELVLSEPQPSVFVKKLDDAWLEIAVWPWASTENWWAATTELPKVLRLGLDEAGVAVPYPRHEIEMTGDEKS